MASYTALEPSSLSSLGVPVPTFSGSSASFFATSTFLYALLFSAIVMAAFYRYVTAGVIRMQSSENAIRQSNEIIKKVTLGLLGVFSLFLILFTVNKGLVTGDVGLSGLKAGRGTITPAVPVTTPVSTSRGSYEDRVKSHRAVVARLTPSNIHTNRGDAPCSESQFNERRPSCTSLAYLPEEAIQMILKINADCRCTVVITGGTEPGHTTHGEGKRAFDLRLGGARGDPNNTDPLYVFIKGRAINKLGASGNCFERYLWNTFTFCDEKPPSNPPPTWAPHFHVY